MVIAGGFIWLLILTIALFFGAKTEEQPRSQAEASGQSWRSQFGFCGASESWCSHRFPGAQALGRPAEAKSFCRSRWGQPTGFGLTSLALVYFSLVSTCKIYLYTFKLVFKWWWNCHDFTNYEDSRVSSGNNICHCK